MASKTLAVRFRPMTWEDMSGQDSIKVILDEQIKTKTFKNGYLFAGASGCGKTTSARIFANKINDGKGNPIEIDAASNSGVENMREINESAKKKALDCEYKVFIIDECHSLSSSAWQAMLKTLEDCPKYTIFILCTTDPHKIPATVLNRVQRYDFSKISTDKILARLDYICEVEKIAAETEALQYICRLANGGMRDAISMLDKVSSLNKEITVQSVVDALGTVNYDIYFDLLEATFTSEKDNIIRVLESVHESGKDIKQFLKSYQNFLVDVCKYNLFKSFEYTQLPATEKVRERLQYVPEDNAELLDFIIEMNGLIKWDSNPLYTVEALFLSKIKGE